MEILGHKNNEVWGTIYLKCYKTRLHASLIPKFPRGDTPGPPLKRTEGEGKRGRCVMTARRMDALLNLTSTSPRLD